MRAGRWFSRRWLAPAMLIGFGILAGGCVSPAPALNPAQGYTISRQRPNEVLTGRPIRNLIAGANLNRGEIEGVLEANPGLREALVRDGIDLDRVTGLRVSPTRVVDVYYRGA